MTPEDAYQAISRMREHPVAKSAKTLGVSRSGYYNWLNSKEEQQVRDAEYEESVLDTFRKGKGHYGAERICGVIRMSGGHASFEKVQDILKKHHLSSSHTRRRQRSLTDSRKARGDGYQNLTKDLEITMPFQVLSSDISYIRTGEGFDYLCQIRDVCTKVVLARQQQERMTKDIVLKALEQVQNRWHLPQGLIFHSDRGSQYTADEVMQRIARFGWQQSFSRVRKPRDNAWSESFFSILKKEAVHWHHFETREEARQSLFEYIEVYYNTMRVQKRLGYLSPIQFLKHWQAENLTIVA